MSSTITSRQALIRRSSWYVSLECRFAAFLIDTCLFFFAFTFSFYFLEKFSSQASPVINVLFAPLEVLLTDRHTIGLLLNLSCCFLILHWLYYAFMESSAKQGTIGKMALNIKVASLSGKKISFWQASVRYFFRYISIGLLFGGFIIALFSPKKQTLHDIIAGCTIRIQTFN